MSLPVDEVMSVLRDHLSGGEEGNAQLQAIAKDLLRAEREIKAEKKDAPKRGKTRLVALIRGTPELKALVAGGAFIMAVPDGEDDPTTSTYSGDALLNRIKKAVATHNEAPKGRGRRAKKTIIRTFAEAMRWLRPKSIKQSESAFSIRAKGDPVEVVVVEAEEVDKL